MLEEIIKELTVTSNDDHITSGGVLAWAKRVEAQRTQAAVLDMLTESRQFDKVKISKNQKKTTLELQLVGHHSDSHASSLADYTHRGNVNVWHMGRHVQVVARQDTLRRYATAEERGW